MVRLRATDRGSQVGGTRETAAKQMKYVKIKVIKMKPT